MLKWQEDLSFQAEEAAHLCFACGQHGHYPNECPRKLRPQVVAAPREDKTPSFYVFIFGLVLGLVVGMCLMRGFA